MSICVISGHWSELERQGVHFSHELSLQNMMFCMHIYYNLSFDISEHFL